MEHTWDIISDIILGVSIIILGVFAILGLIQLIKKRSLKKVDRPLLAMFVPVGLDAITYLIFEKFLVLNTRPNGSGEPSFPSTHVLIVSTIFFCVAIMLPYYIKSKLACALIYVFMAVFIVLVVAGRLISNMHWPTDVIGSLVFSTVYAFIYYLIIRRKNHA